MTKNRLFPSLLMVALAVPSCSTQHLASRGHNLKPGVRYEVRKAIAAGETFKPQLLTSYFFVIDPASSSQVAAYRSAPSFSPYASGFGSRMTVRTTAYTHSEADHLVYGRKNAVGGQLKYGSVRSAAADWSRFPLGTRFRIAGNPEVYEVDDYGSALVGTGTIDLYKPSRGMMNSWGVRHVDIEVLSWGSYERSRQMLQDRTRYPHVRKMFYDIQRQINQAAVSTKTTPITAMSEPTKAFGPMRSPSI